MAYVISLGQKLELKPSISEQCDINWLYTYGLTLKQTNSVACIEVKLFMKLITFIDLLKRYKYFIETLHYCLKHIFEGGT